jgi:hypothetical protein
MKWTLIGAYLALAPLFFASPARSETVRIEAESMTGFSDRGGTAIHVTNCSAASQRLAVDGLDREGEWIRFRLDLTHSFCFVDSIRSAGAVGETRTFSIEFAPDPPALTACEDTVTTIPGMGVG